MKIRFAFALLASMALGAVPAYAGHNEPVSLPQLPYPPVSRTGDNSITGMLSQANAIGLNMTYSNQAGVGGGPTGSQCGVGLAGVVAVGAGNAIAFDPTLSCIITPSADHQRTSLLVSGTSTIDAEAEEQLLAIHGYFNKGYKKPYAASTSYNVGDVISVGSPGEDYRACPAGSTTLAQCPAGVTTTSAGTTGASSAPPGTHPSGSTPPFYTDGSVTWLWINDATIDGKLNIYSEATVLPGTGAAWNMAMNFQMQPNLTPTGDKALEIDFTNNAATCNLGAANCIGIALAANGIYRSTTGYDVQGGNTSGGGFIWGFRSEGYNSGADFESDGSANVGLNLGGTYGTAALRQVLNGTVVAQLDPSGNFSTQNLTVNGGYLGATPTFVNAATLTIGSTSSSTVERTIFGSQSTAGEADFDMHSSGTTNGYDARIQVKGGSSTQGQGSLNLYAGALSMNGTAAVSCTGAPSSSYAVVNGIVTHC